MPNETEIPIEDSGKETVERLLSEKQSESVSVSPSGTTTSVTNHSIDQTIKGLEFLRNENATPNAIKTFRVAGNSMR